MKKRLIILLGIILVTGCSNNDADEPAMQDQEVSDEIVEDEENLEDHSNTIDRSDTVINNEDLKKFPEFDKIAEHIDLNIYQGIVETDNKGSRVILFENEKGHSEYKSIFVKHDSRLKIVQFNNGGLLYNEIIK